MSDIGTTRHSRVDRRARVTRAMLPWLTPYGSRGYTEPMRSVADQLRMLTAARVLEMPVADRVRLALALGDDDLALFARTNGLARGEALRRLSAQRRRGRTPSDTASRDR